MNASISASSNYYLQAVLRSIQSSKYFGETQNNHGDYIDYVSTPEKEFIQSNFFLTNIQNSTWSGQIKLRFKYDDPNYFGPGNYELKLRRYTGNSSSSAGDSNTINIVLNTALPQPSPAPVLSPSPSPTPTPVPTPSLHASPSLSPSPRNIPPSPDIDFSEEATIAGISDIDTDTFQPISDTSPSPSVSPSTKSPTLNKSRLKSLVFIGAGFLLIGISVFMWYQKVRKV
ncbi:MAG: hypothetical protein E6R05_01735 [Candidatus Moraniibacteriota bacterium]|nr:MAG: hypothetical protein E6R05_01735 [Candidatus Moranbacteria bacterium]